MLTKHALTYFDKNIHVANLIRFMQSSVTKEHFPNIGLGILISTSSLQIFFFQPMTMIGLSFHQDCAITNVFF